MEKKKPDSSCPPGSIEQQLDMCEEGDLRGDEVQHRNHSDSRPRNLSEVIGRDANFQVDMSTEDREGDEMSGDEHSSGMQGGEPVVEQQPHFSSGNPGEETQDEESNVLEFRKRRAS